MPNLKIARKRDCVETIDSNIKIPEHIKGGIERFVFHGLLPGHFLTAVLTNDLIEAVNRADDESLDHLGPIVKFVYNEIPSTCWGTKLKVAEWNAQKQGERDKVTQPMYS